MAKASNGNATTFAGDGAVWFKVCQVTVDISVYDIGAVTNGGTSITWPAQNLPGVSFTLPKSLPSGQYLGNGLRPIYILDAHSPSVRMEAIALHSASTFGGGGSAKDSFGLPQSIIL
ncbi:hypothetical protein C0991_005251 [Blastosporella zonata]|nr:hypothetical protein C0991_005251 [Blastosporella zonata]